MIEAIHQALMQLTLEGCGVLFCGKDRAMRRVDWAGWLKPKWNRSRRSLGQRPRWVVESSPRVIHHDLGSAVELLERRELLEFASLS